MTTQIASLEGQITRVKLIAAENLAFPERTPDPIAPALSPSHHHEPFSRA